MVAFVTIKVTSCSACPYLKKGENAEPYCSHLNKDIIDTDVINQIYHLCPFERFKIEKS